MEDDILKVIEEHVEFALRKEFEGDDKLALLDCIVCCHDYGLTIPAWARDTLAEAASAYLQREHVTLDEAIFGVNRDIGRHGKLSTKRWENRKHHLIYATVEAMKDQGFKGDELFEISQDVLGRLIQRKTLGYCIPINSSESVEIPKLETIKHVRKTMRKHGPPSPYDKLIANMAYMDLVENGGGKS